MGPLGAHNDKARWGGDHAAVRETWQPVIHVPASSSRTAQGERPGSASATDKRAGTRSRDSSFLPSTQNNSRAFDPEMHITLNSRTRDALSLPTPRFLRYRKEGCPTRISPSLFHRLPSHPPSRGRTRLSRLFTLEFSSCRSPFSPTSRLAADSHSPLLASLACQPARAAIRHRLTLRRTHTTPTCRPLHPTIRIAMCLVAS